MDRRGEAVVRQRLVRRRVQAPARQKTRHSEAKQGRRLMVSTKRRAGRQRHERYRWVSVRGRGPVVSSDARVRRTSPPPQEKRPPAFHFSPSTQTRQWGRVTTALTIRGWTAGLLPLRGIELASLCPLTPAGCLRRGRRPTLHPRLSSTQATQLDCHCPRKTRRSLTELGGSTSAGRTRV